MERRVQEGEEEYSDKFTEVAKLFCKQVGHVQCVFVRTLHIVSDMRACEHDLFSMRGIY